MAYDSEMTTVSYPMATAVHAYIQRLLELGAIQGKLGKQELEDEIRKLVTCIHHVVAGGEVKAEMVRKGDPDIVNELEKRVKDGTAQANEINDAAGYYVSILP